MTQRELLKVIEEAKASGATYLDLSNRGITELPPEIGQLTNLKELKLWNNQLTGLPQEICQLKNLIRLDLNNNELTSLPSDFSQLENLITLKLDGNRLSQVPKEICQLRKLERLRLGNNKLSELPEELFQLTNLTRLSLWSNQLEVLSSKISQLINLRVLKLWDNLLTTLPVELCQLTNLDELDLSRNKLTALPPKICQLTNLTEIHLNDNQLTTLPSEICQLSKLQRVEFGDNPLTSPPPEIAEQGIEVIHQYFVSLQAGERPLNEVKILLIGDGAAGKTSLVNRLFNQPFDEHEDTTHGISIRGWKQEIGGQEIRINIWDFGGQEIQHATHQFFLSKRSLYVLVLDGRKDERTEYWLRHIEAFGGDSPVLVVLNKMDSNALFDVNRGFLLKKYPSIRGFLPTSCRTGDGIADFKMALLDNLAKVEMIGITWPASWFAVKRKLEKADKHYISTKEYNDICEDEKIDDKQSQERLVDFLHDLGVVVHFQDVDLKEMHVLDPIWVTNAVYKIITAKQMANSKGLLCLKCLGEILPHGEGEKHCCPPHTYSFILRLMQKFELCYPINEETVLIPQLLPVPEPEFSFDYSNSLRFALHYPDFLPPSVFPRFMVNVYKDIEDGLHWRTGVVLKDIQNGVRAVIKADTEARRINIWVQGKRRRDYLHYLRYLLTYINSSFEKLTVSERVPMPDDPERTADYETLRKCAERGIERYMPDGTDKDYSVKELLGLVQLKDAGELSIISEKVEFEFDEKLSFVDILLKVLKVRLFPPSITLDLTELLKLIRAWDKQRQGKASK